MAKPKKQSRTLWVNAIVGGTAAALALLAAEPGFHQEIGPVWTRLLLVASAVVGAINAGVNIVLRLHTGEPLDGTPAARQQDRLRLLPPEPRRPPPRRSSG